MRKYLKTSISIVVDSNNSNKMSVETRIHLKPVETRPGMYDSYDVHKMCYPPFRPISSALETPTYKLAKVLVSVLEPLTTNKYTV